MQGHPPWCHRCWFFIAIDEVVTSQAMVRIGDSFWIQIPSFHELGLKWIDAFPELGVASTQNEATVR